MNPDNPTINRLGWQIMTVSGADPEIQGGRVYQTRLELKHAAKMARTKPETRQVYGRLVRLMIWGDETNFRKYRVENIIGPFSIKELDTNPLVP